MVDDTRAGTRTYTGQEAVEVHDYLTSYCVGPAQAASAWKIVRTLNIAGLGRALRSIISDEEQKALMARYCTGGANEFIFVCEYREDAVAKTDSMERAAYSQLRRVAARREFEQTLPWRQPGLFIP
jgi:hypothetical protein